MKIALCYSGNLRTYEHCVLNHSSLLTNADIFISTWDKISVSNSINDKLHYKVNINPPELVTEDYIIKKTPLNLKIKSIKIDNYSDVNLKKIKTNPLYPDERTQGLSYQYFKIKDCFDLVVKSNEDYDFVIRLRPDIILDKFVFEKDKLVFENNIWYGNPYSFEKYAINEMVWISNMHLMEKSCKIYDNIEIINDILPPNLIYGESFCFRNLIVENIVEHIKVQNLNYKVIR